MNLAPPGARANRASRRWYDALMDDGRTPSDDVNDDARHGTPPQAADTIAGRRPAEGDDVTTVTLRPGVALLGRYALENEIGRGGMGAVYRARDLELDRDVAVKVLGRATGDAHACERLKREARAAAALNHPGVVGVHDVGEQDGAPFLVMELVEGTSLRHHSIAGVEAICAVARQICDALDHIHGHGIVHRDLKPENVLVDGEASEVTVKITDLGVALAAPDARITAAGAIVGTASYLAPEQALGQELDGRVDLYALGVMLYELLTGRPPFQGENALAVISQHLHAPIVPPRTLCSDVPDWLERIVTRLLSKDRDDRFADASELRTALEAAGDSARAADTIESVAFLEGLVRGRLVGRSAELDQLRQIWMRSTEGHGQIALVSGEPGAGKTRLARELSVAARLTGATILTGGCYEYEATTPYLPFVEALRQWVHRVPDDVLQRTVGSGAAELARLAPELADRIGPLAPPPTLEPQEERLRLFDHVARFLQTLAHEQPVLLVFEDLHWADTGTIALLHYVLRQLRDDRLMVLGTYREVELDRVHPLARALVDWDRERFAVRVPLARLTSEQTAALLATMLGQDTVTEGFAAAIFNETEGNPFFIEETVKTLIDQGQIEHRTGEWFLRDEIEALAIPQSVRAAISRRLDRLSEDCTTVLHTAAAIGKTFEFDELAQVVAVGEDAVLDALDEASTAQLIVASGRDAFTFTHDKIREVLYEELNPIRMRRLHRRIAEAIERMYPDRLEDHAKELAHHYVESGDLEQGCTWSTTAAEQAASVFAQDEANLYYTRAMDCAEDLGDTERLAELGLRSAQVYLADGDVIRASAALERALERTEDANRRILIQSYLCETYGMQGDPRGRPYVEALVDSLDPSTHAVELARAVLYAGRYRHHDGDYDATMGFCQRAFDIALEAGAMDIAVRALAFKAGSRQQVAHLDESNAAAQESIDFGTRHEIPGAVAMGYEYLAENASIQGRWDLTIEQGARSRAIGAEIHSRDRIVWGDLCRAAGYSEVGRLRRAVAIADETVELADAIGEVRLATLARDYWAMTEIELGHVERALDIANESVARADDSKQAYLRADARRGLGYVLLRLGRVDQALTAYEDILVVGPGPQAANPLLFTAGFWALALLEHGRLEDARQRAMVGLEIAERAASTHFGALAHRALAMIQATEGDLPGALATFGTVIDTLNTTHSRVALVLTHRMRAALLRDAGQLEASRADLQQAIAIMESTDIRLDLERTREELAALEPA